MSRRFNPLEGLASDLPWILLYVVSFTLQALAGTVRVVLFVVPVELAFKLDHHDPYGTASNVILALLAFGSLAWSVTALVHPLASGRFWQAQTGGRAPSQREREIVEDAFSEIHAADPTVRVPRSWFVLDEWAFNAAIFGDTMMVTTALLDDPALTAVIAHELGHLNSPDGYVVVALTRLGTPARLLIPVRNHLGERGGCLLVPLAGLIGLASGNWGLRLASPLWDVWWRAREFKADAYAARLGFADQLADALDREALDDDQPIPFRFIYGASHPYTEHRIDALEDYANRHDDVTA